MDIKDFAKQLNDREYMNEITNEESERAEELGFVVVFGASDDLIEFRGAIYDDSDCFEGGKIYVDKDGLFTGCECECIYSQKAKKNCRLIEAIWSKGDYAWQYKTDIPHETFEILDYGEKYCKGMVFDIKELSK